METLRSLQDQEDYEDVYESIRECRAEIYHDEKLRTKIS